VSPIRARIATKPRETLLVLLVARRRMPAPLLTLRGRPTTQRSPRLPHSPRAEE
jgi:hypothetical protein